MSEKKTREFLMTDRSNQFVTTITENFLYCRLLFHLWNFFLKIGFSLSLNRMEIDLSRAFAKHRKFSDRRSGHLLFERLTTGDGEKSKLVGRNNSMMNFPSRAKLGLDARRRKFDRAQFPRTFLFIPLYSRFYIFFLTIVLTGNSYKCWF